MDDTTMDSYNENTSLIRTSQIPSRIPSPNKGIGLVEISASATNSRTMSGMAPPEAGGLKYKPLAHPDAGPKRKTLAERAGEVSQVKLPAPPSSRPFSSSVRATALSGVRNPSFSSSVSATRNPPYHSRNVSTSSFASSIGPGVHPPSTQSLRRPQTSYGSVRSAMPVPTISSRPASSMDTRVTNPTSTLGKRKGMKFHNSVNLNAVGLYNVNELCDAIERSPAFGCSSTSRRRPRSSRDFSLTSAMNKLSLEAEGSPPSGSSNLFLPKTPSKKKSPCSPMTPLKVTKSLSSPKKVYYLTRDSNTPGAPTVLEDEREPRREWNTQARLDKMENMYNELQKAVSGTADERNSMTETINLFKAKIHELEEIRSQLSAKNATLTAELSNTKECLSKMTTVGDDERRNFRSQTDEQRRQHLADLDNAKRKARDEVDRLIKLHHEELYDLERRLKNELEDERSRRVREVQEAEVLGSIERRKADTYMDSKDQEVHNLKVELEKIQGAFDSEKLLQKNLQENLTASTTENVTLKSELRGLRARIDFLESDSSAQAQSFTDLEQRMQDAIAASKEAMEKLRKEETLRRKLHNQVQELKGNIRVFCRVRPPLEIDSSNSLATIAFPNDEVDAKEVEVQGPEEKSSLGTITTKKHPFSFDRVFGPNSENQEIFEEISQLVQSALDGYNVCIFCYGQTGSGKTHTMSAEDGMIPRAVHQIYETAVSLEEKGWTYTMEGSFVEVYNENLNDLLGKAGDLDNGKLDIRHDPQTRKTWVTGLQSKTLDSPDKVHEILRKASKNRSVAATKANERSSRSHSVFILKLQGHNAITGESSEGTLNLVDLAGSERLSHSGATGDRLKETQNINRSLSCLGDVIGALGRGREGGHIPYRNSKLTELLQYSLGGNSKTLMFVMISPLQAHLSETLTSLKFATKVHNTHIGTAKKQSKVRD